MSVTIGSQLGPYEIVSILGAGGMGEVYRARDTRLGRDVALKILPVAFSTEESRRVRFEQEARAVAALNHPNIVAVYDVGSQDGLSYMASELVEGESLRALIEQGPLPARRLIDIGAQLAEGLSAAHSVGIVHRDLKPENIILARDGRVKILDFGLARQTVSGGPAEATRTIVRTATLPGSILGTVAYMSPEQVRGQIADHRSDIFTLGIILHEIATGSQPFRGDSSVETMNAVLKEEPPELPGTVGPALRLIIGRCLEKDPDRRFQSASDLAFALRSVSSGAISSPAIAVANRRGIPKLRAAMLAMGALVVVAGAMILLRPRPQPAGGRLVHLVVPMPAGDRLIPTSVAVSPDGNTVAYVARRSGQSQIFVRALADPAPRLLAGTEEASTPLFSYRGDSVIFLQQQKLKRIPLTGGAVTEIAGNQVPRGFSSLPDGSIVGVPAFDSSVKAYDPETRAERTLLKGDAGFVIFSPEVIDNGRSILYSRMKPASPPSIYARRFNGDAEGSPLIENAGVPRYASGYLLYDRMGTLNAVPFDPETLTTAGAAMRLSLDGNASTYDVAEDVLVYVTGEARLGSKQLTYVERSGATRPIATLDGDFVNLALSPDGRRVALGSYGDDGDIWTYDLDRGVASRLTFEKEEEETPIWSPDGMRIAYAASRQKRVVAVRLADGSGPEQIIATLPSHAHLHSWSPDGKFILLSILFNAGQNDLWVMPADGSSPPREFVRSPFSKLDAAFSPDGKWVSYTSNETGRREVYITAFPGPGGKLQISNMGGQNAVWSSGGRELYYRDRNHIMAVTLQPGPPMKVSVPRPIFDAPDYAAFAATPDGKFVALPIDHENNPADLHVVLNWQRALKPATSNESN